MTTTRCFLAVAALALASCTTGGLAPEDALGSALCTNAQKGTKYSLCGRLTTGTLNATSPGQKTAKASLDVVRNSNSANYQLTGGTVHASH